MLRAAIRDGDAPNLGVLAERGEAVWDAVSVFPSITPAATAAIATGEAPAKSGIVGHAWYDEYERRVVVYGAMTETVMASGPIRVFHNNVWRMNRDDLHAATLFEALHDRGFDGACVNFPVRRGPHTHPVRMKTIEGYLMGGRYLGPSVQGPKEYFMGDLFYSRDTGFSGRKANGGVLRSVGINDDYAARVGAMLLKERAAPFNLVYFFKGDSIAHHHGLEAQRRWLATADEYVARLFSAGGGVDRVLEDYAVLALSDHGHAPLLPKSRYVDLRMLQGQKVSSGVKARFRNGTTVVVVPNGRSALLYLREDVELESVVEKLVGRRGVDLAAWMEDGWAAVRRLGREVRFLPGSGVSDPFGRSWELEGDPRADQRSGPRRRSMSSAAASSHHRAVSAAADAAPGRGRGGSRRAVPASRRAPAPPSRCASAPRRRPGPHVERRARRAGSPRSARWDRHRRAPPRSSRHGQPVPWCRA